MHNVAELAGATLRIEDITIRGTYRAVWGPEIKYGLPSFLAFLRSSFFCRLRGSSAIFAALQWIECEPMSIRLVANQECLQVL